MRQPKYKFGDLFIKKDTIKHLGVSHNVETIIAIRSVILRDDHFNSHYVYEMSSNANVYAGEYSEESLDKIYVKNQ